MRAVLPIDWSLRSPGRLACAVVFAWAAVALAPQCLASAQFHAQNSALPANLPQNSRPGTASKSTAPPPKPAVKRQTKPLWTELTPAQQQALAPLAGTWDTVSEA